ncbi:uncharacterized protein LOC116940178 isoform X2 [Petromyzon marinus]|uniref:Uncharacterized protein LOC116940178 isoform X2 n=1 Tax=Petromyzon marinus TaxID=7757 RepID=A0AAJ7SVU7_PETMA|nr:uncharacterized protein LOC116940178 isoform X2 [Petromyzon marinus]
MAGCVSSGYTLVPHKLGMVVRGIHLAQGDVPRHVVEQIKSDVTKHRLLIFKDQGIISGQKQVDITRWFGEPESTFYNHPKSPHPDVFRVSNDPAEGCTGVGRTGWHIDGSFMHAPFAYSIYHIVRVPKRGATDTVLPRGHDGGVRVGRGGRVASSRHRGRGDGRAAARDRARVHAGRGLHPVRARVGGGGLHHFRQPGAGPRGPPLHAGPTQRRGAPSHAPHHRVRRLDPQQTAPRGHRRRGQRQRMSGSARARVWISAFVCGSTGSRGNRHACASARMHV